LRVLRPSDTGRIQARVRRLFRLDVRRRDLRHDVDEEIRLHIDLRVEQLVGAGVPDAAAREQATAWFAGAGNTLEDAARALRASAARQEARMAVHEWFADLGRDARLAGRALLRAPAFTAVAIATLALGIGSSTAVFSVVDGVLLKPLPFREPDRLVGVYHFGGEGASLVSQGPATYFTYREYNRVFEDVGAWDVKQTTLSGRGEPERVDALLVTDGTLRLLGVRPVVGRIFNQADDAPRAPRRVILSYGQWQRRFGGVSTVLGQTLGIDGVPCEIIGVLPASFRFLRTDPGVVLPMQLDRANVWVVFYFRVLARLKPGVTLTEANSDIARMIALVTDWVPGYTEWKLKPSVRPLSKDVTGGIDDVLWILAGSVAVVLLIAWANVTNLFLARAETRRQELAVRAALGATRSRVGRALLLESLMVGVAGAAVGLLFAWGGIGLIRRMAPASLPRIDEIGIGRSVLLFALGLGIVTGILFAVVLVLRFGVPNADALKHGGRSVGASPLQRRTRSMLVVGQIAMALVLLIVSGLLVRTFVAIERVRPGFVRPREVLTFRLSVPSSLIEDSRQVARLHMEIADRVRSVPGVASVGLSSSITMDGDANANPTLIEHVSVPAGALPPHRRFKYIGTGYFETMGNALVAGRALDANDILRPAAVVVVSETLAREYWQKPSDALGKRLTNCPTCPWREIVGVVGDERDDGSSRPATPIVYWPMLIENFGDGPISVKRTMAYAVRSPRVASPEFVRELQRAVWSVRADLPLAKVAGLDDVQARSVARTSFAMVMLAIGASVALLLGVVGIYGVISYVASQRTREIGIRVALGAQRGDVRGLILREGLLLAGAGIAVGVVTALALSRVMTALLFGVSAMDPATYVTVSAGLAAVALLATWLPARRASRVDPVAALRAES
jgi:predicted permease